MTYAELLTQQLSKEQVLDLHINGMIDLRENRISQTTFSRLNNLFQNTFSSKEIDELFKVDKSLPSLKKILEGKVKQKPVLVDETNK